MDNRDLDISGKPTTQASRQERDVMLGRWCCCLNCAHWDKTGCFKAKGQTPPPKVLVVGCPSWEMDIPF